jgi:hypothetical protein
MTTLNPQILGQAENAHRAVLTWALTGTGLTYESYVALKIVTGAALDAAQFAARVGGALKVDESATRSLAADLAAAGLVTTGPVIGPTEAGRDLLIQVAAAVADPVGRAYADIPPEDLATAGRVLALITTRLDSALSTG